MYFDARARSQVLLLLAREEEENAKKTHTQRIFISAGRNWSHFQLMRERDCLCAPVSVLVRAYNMIEACFATNKTITSIENHK